MAATRSNFEEAKKCIDIQYANFNEIGRRATVVVNSESRTISIHPDFLSFTEEDFKAVIEYAKSIGSRVYDEYTDEVL